MATATVLTSYAEAASWEFSPSVQLRETYTDNLRLAPEGSERSDFVTELVPGFRLRGEGQRLKVQADYRMQNLLYARAKDDVTTNHHLRAKATSELLPEALFVDAHASLSLQAVSPFGPQPLDSLNLTRNQTRLRTWSLSPYFRQRIGSLANSEIRYSYATVQTGANAALDADVTQLRLRAKSSQRFYPFSWNLGYSRQKTASERLGATTVENSAATVGYFVSPRLNINLTAGYEDNDYAEAIRGTDGGFWMAGGTWRPGPRTQFDAKAGRRPYGNAYALTASHRMRVSTWELQYTEDVTTSAAQILALTRTSIPDFQGNQQRPSGQQNAQLGQPSTPENIATAGRDGAQGAMAGAPPLTDLAFLQKAWRASLGLVGARHAARFSFFSSEREALSAAAGLEQHADQRGASATWTFQAGAQTTVVANFSYTRAHAPVTRREDINRTVRLGLHRQLNPRLSGSIEVRRNVQESNQGFRSLEENAIAAFLTRSF